MTTIQTGGGPTLEQRRAFAGLKEGSEVPGYRGYIPQIKYRVGGTYGNDTSALNTDYGMKRAATIVGAGAPEVVSRSLPVTDGDKKFTERMVPGYTGYVPRLMFRYGGTYKHDCDLSIDNFLTARDGHAGKMTELVRHTKATPPLTAVSHDPQVRDRLNRYRDTHPTPATLVADKRPMAEPPIPGYQGYIPRIYPTEVGLGRRYHDATDAGLGLFTREQHHHKAVNADNKAVTLAPDKICCKVEGIPCPSVDFTTSTARPGLDYSARLYKTDGMIPKYTGYIPQRRYVFGNTYGDETRGLQVCAHEAPNFGGFVRSKTLNQ